MTFSDISENSIVLPGLNRVYAIGDVAYRYRNSKKNVLCKLFPVTYINGNWEYTHLAKPITKNINDFCTLIS